MRNKLWYVTSAYPTKEGTGSDFYLENLQFFKNFGFRIINTLDHGHLVMMFNEILLLFIIPKNATIITTWPGYPRQLLILNGFSNSIRFKIFTTIKKLKKWKYYIIPIDLPLQQFSFRLKQVTIVKQEKLERIIFAGADGFICAGVGMENYFKMYYPFKEFYMFDMYDQILPEYSGNKKLSFGVKKIAIIGNLSRMTDEIESLPKHEGIQYHFLGPNGDKVLNSNREDFTYRGSLLGEEFIKELATCDFGLILYSKSFEKYASRAIAGKVTTYIHTALPVICPSKYSSMSELVNRLDIGLVINELSELITILSVSDGKYQMWVENCVKEKQQIKTGGHYLKVLKEMGLK